MWFWTRVLLVVIVNLCLLMLFTVLVFSYPKFVVQFWNLWILGFELGFYLFGLVGAVMFLFRGVFGHVLYTGDFRWELSDERALKARNMLRDALQGAKLDVLYLDNTYCNPAFCFPTRQVAAQQVTVLLSCFAYPLYLATCYIKSIR